MKIFKQIITILAKASLIFVLFLLWANPTFAHRSPEGCTGSGLGIGLYTDLTEVYVGDTINFSVTIFNSAGGVTGKVVCDATDIQASLVTPDGTVHPISLKRTTLLNEQGDEYPNIVTYTARTEDINNKYNTLNASANDTGSIHQNDTNSQGGGHQSVNVRVLTTLNVIKHVINDNGGSASASNFTMNVIGTNVYPSSFAGSESGVDVLLDAGSYSVTETGPITNYTKSNSGDCSGTIATGQRKTCTITNDDNAPVPPTNQTNTGVVPPVTPPVVVPPAVIPSTSNGGGGGGAVILPPTVKNLPVISPLIHVTKTPSPLTLPAKGGAVIYTEEITNPGTISLSNVRLVDDKCSPVNYISGDTNGNLKLDIAETWVYTCQTNLIKTTANTATAEGEANGLTVRSVAIATVIVPAPSQVLGIKITKFPNTGLPPQEKNIPRNITLLIEILILASIPLAVIFKKREI